MGEPLAGGAVQQQALVVGHEASGGAGLGEEIVGHHALSVGKIACRVPGRVQPDLTAGAEGS